MVKKHHGEIGKPKLVPATLLNVKHAEHMLGLKANPPAIIRKK